MSTALATRIAQEHEASAAQRASTPESANRQRLAIEALAARGLPTSRDENWKYAGLRSLERARFAPPSRQHPAPGLAAALPRPLEGYSRHVFVDGHFEAEYSIPSAKTGLVICTSPAAVASPLAAHHDDERFALLNEAFSGDGAYVEAAASGEAHCVELVFVASADSQSAASHPRIDIVTTSGARLSVVERHLSIGSDANLVNCAVRVHVAEGARVEHVRVQQAGARSTWIDTLLASVARDGDYQLNLINLGGVSARSTLRAVLVGERAQIGLRCASIASRHQVQDVYAHVEHVAANAVSRQGFRGISGGRARVAFNSKAVVQDTARGTDAHQSLRGLITGAEAEVDVRPQLEIYTDDVRCAHGATTGKLDEVMLFYLLSRGLDQATAQMLLKWAFLEDVVSKVEVADLRRQIEQAVAGHMGDTALEELL
jgi:Fe-S cluster assembly protein SufD